MPNTMDSRVLRSRNGKIARGVKEFGALPPVQRCDEVLKQPQMHRHSSRRPSVIAGRTGRGANCCDQITKTQALYIQEEYVGPSE